MTWERPWSINNGKWWYPPDLLKPAVRATPPHTRVTATHSDLSALGMHQGLEVRVGKKQQALQQEGLLMSLGGRQRRGSPCNDNFMTVRESQW